MATLVVKAKPGAGLQQYTVEIDGQVAVAAPAKSGSVVVEGVCGDGSNHRADYAFYGPAGKTFGFSVKCGNATVLSVVGAKVPVQTAPNAAGGEDFAL